QSRHLRSQARRAHCRRAALRGLRPGRARTGTPAGRVLPRGRPGQLDQGAGARGAGAGGRHRMLARALARLGLKTREQQGWGWYDWANSTYFTTVITAVFPSFFATYAAAGLEPAEATGRFALLTTLSIATVAITSPILGALADLSGIRKKLL